jgi:CheY-like chemotaxis protein
MPKILIVEDNTDVREMLSERLKRKTYHTRQAGNGREALEQAARDRPDLILMDVSMPDMDGLEATRRLKADPALCAIPVIILTAHAYAEDQAKARAAGCDDYLPKPVDFAALLRKIQALLSASETGA